MLKNDTSLGRYLLTLSDNLQSLKEYQLYTGNYRLDYKELKRDLFSDDPIIVLFAMLITNYIFNDRNLYH